jgi:hypothetical protein
MATKRKINKPPILFRETQKVLGEIENELGYPCLAFWHGPNGDVCEDDVLTFYTQMRHLGPRKRIGLFLKSNGGTGMVSLRIVHLLRQYCEELVVLIPLNCVSAATMIALGADEIQMGPLAYLSAVDTSLTHDLSPLDANNNRVSVSLDELTRILHLWRKEGVAESSNPYSSIFQHIHPLVIGAVDRSSSLSIRLCTEILTYHLADKRRAATISKLLNSDYPWHSYPITLREAHRIGLNAVSMKPTINDRLLELNEIYSEMGQRALTDYDERNYHDNEIVDILEGRGLQLFYQSDKDWHYRVEERRWTSLHNNSRWVRVERKGTQVVQRVLHIR